MDNRLRLLARYVVGRYRLGHENLALYLAGVLFEIIIERKLSQIQQIPRYVLQGRNLSQLAKRIDRLEMISFQDDPLYKQPDVFKYYVESIDRKGRVKEFNFCSDDNHNLYQLKRRLHNFRWLRNHVMHGTLASMPEENDNKKEDMINYIWESLASDSFKITYDHWSEECPLDSSIIFSMKEHTADYLVRDIDEMDIKPKDISVGYNPDKPFGVKFSDFSNLYELRKKLIPLKNYLADWIRKREPTMSNDILTTIDTTSGYIWIPLTQMHTKPDGTRTGILSCSVSILATPLDLRVYMDFGGRAREERESYYNFLSNDVVYTETIGRLNMLTSLRVFDIDWYSHLFNDRAWVEWKPETRLGEAKGALSELKERQPPDSDDPITWNRLLHGYIFNKHELRKSRGNDFEITFQDIEQQLLDILSFYRSFQDFCLKKGNNSE